MADGFRDRMEGRAVAAQRSETEEEKRSKRMAESA
jgi:hypothetical protein